MLEGSTVQKKNKQPCYIKDENGPFKLYITNSCDCSYSSWRASLHWFLFLGLLKLVNADSLWSHWLLATSARRSQVFCVVAYILWSLLTTGWMVSEQCSAFIPTVPLKMAFSGTWNVRTWNVLSRLVLGMFIGNQWPKLAHLALRIAISWGHRGALAE